MKIMMTGGLIALSLALGACSSKPKTTPVSSSIPAPAGAAVGGEGGTGLADGGVASRALPGSQADLVAQVGTDRVLFGYDEHTLSDEAKAILQRQARWLAANPSVRLVVEGHCDERGTREYNLALGDRRATAVAQYLSALGISPSRLQTISYGKERPEMTGADEQSHAQNRRAVSLVAGGDNIG